MTPRVERLTVLGLLAFLRDRLAAEGNRAALQTIRSLGGIADDDELDDVACMEELRQTWRGLNSRVPLFDEPLLWRDDADERIVDAAPLEAALDRIGQILTQDATA